MNPSTTVKSPLIIGFASRWRSQPPWWRNHRQCGEPPAGCTSSSAYLDRPAVPTSMPSKPAAMAVAAAIGRSRRRRINPYVAPRPPLLWFRWSALGTWLPRCGVAVETPGRFISTFTLGLMEHPAPPTTVTMGVSWLGTIMLFNVWVLIWPNQKKILGLMPATDETEGDGTQSRPVCLAGQLRAVHPPDFVHGSGRRTDCLSERWERSGAESRRSAETGGDRAGRGCRQRRCDGGAGGPAISRLTAASSPASRGVVRPPLGGRGRSGSSIRGSGLRGRPTMATSCSQTNGVRARGPAAPC